MFRPLHLFAFKYVFVFVSLSFPGSVACLAIVQVLCGLTHHVLELHRLDEFCVPLQNVLVHAIHDLVLPCDVLHLNLVFVRTCPRVLPLYGFSRREAVILCRTSWSLSSVAFASCLVCVHPRMHTLFLASNFAVFSSSSSRYLAVSWTSHLFQMGKLGNCTLHLLGNCRSRFPRRSRSLGWSRSFAKLQLSLLLLDICIGSWMLRDWLAVAFLCTVLLHVIHLVSFVVFWFALPAVGSALLPAGGFALLGSFHHRSKTSCSSRCPRTTGSFAVVVSRILTTCSSAVVPSVLLSHHCLFVCGSACASFSESLCGRLRLRGSFRTTRR